MKEHEEEYDAYGFEIGRVVSFHLSATSDLKSCSSGPMTFATFYIGQSGFFSDFNNKNKNERVSFGWMETGTKCMMS